MVFGCISSPGLFDRVAKIVFFIALRQSGFPSRLAIQHLDDVCACSPMGSNLVDRFYDAYREICEELNVKLADTTDPEKTFSPRTEGVVLGVNYDSADMTWYLSEGKMRIILGLIEELRSQREATAREVKRVCGKLVDIRDLIVGARFYLAHLLMAASTFTEKEDMGKIVEIDDWCEKDLGYFALVLPVYAHRTVLQDPDRRPMAGVVSSHTDAAGGSMESVGRGVGMTVFPRVWTYVPWGRRINQGWRSYDGKSLAHKMSAWELVGPLLTVSCTGNMFSGRQVEVFVDNDGSVMMYNKGWTTKCDLCNTVLLALHQVSTALDIDLWISGVARCSSRETEAADALSKCEMSRFRENMPEADVVPRLVPGALLVWLENPVPDRGLGHKILVELSKSCSVLNYN